MVRLPSVRADEASVLHDRFAPLRHSPDETSWSASSEYGGDVPLVASLASVHAAHDVAHRSLVVRRRQPPGASHPRARAIANAPVFHSRLAGAYTTPPETNGRLLTRRAVVL